MKAQRSPGDCVVPAGCAPAGTAEKRIRRQGTGNRRQRKTRRLEDKETGRRGEIFGVIRLSKTSSFIIAVYFAVKTCRNCAVPDPPARASRSRTRRRRRVPSQSTGGQWHQARATTTRGLVRSTRLLRSGLPPGNPRRQAAR